MVFPPQDSPRCRMVVIADPDGDGIALPQLKSPA